MKNIFLKVKTFPCQKEESIIKKDDNAFEVRVKEKPEQGSANRRMLEILSNYLSIDLKKLKIIKGAKKSNKIIKIL